MRAIDVLKKAPADLEAMTDDLIKSKKAFEIRTNLEAISRFSSMAAAYIGAREAGQDHDKARKAAHEVAEKVWKALGYNGYHKFTF